MRMIKENATKENFALIHSLPPWKIEAQIERKNPWGQNMRVVQNHCCLSSGWPWPLLPWPAIAGWLSGPNGSCWLQYHSASKYWQGWQISSLQGKRLRAFCGFCSNSETAEKHPSRGFYKPPVKGLCCCAVEKETEVTVVKPNLNRIFNFHFPGSPKQLPEGKKRSQNMSSLPSMSTLVHVSLPRPPTRTAGTKPWLTLPANCT